MSFQGLPVCLFQITWREPCDLTRSEACSPPADGSDSRDKPKLYRLQLSVTEVGTEKFDDSSIQVRGRWAGPGRGRREQIDGWRRGRRERRSSSPSGPWPARFSPGHGAAFIECFSRQYRQAHHRGPHATGGRHHSRSARRSG